MPMKQIRTYFINDFKGMRRGQVKGIIIIYRQRLKLYIFFLIRDNINFPHFIKMKLINYRV